MILHIDRSGHVHCLYGEAIDLTALGTLAIRRASHVEPDEHGSWYADLSLVGGPRLGPFALRSAALAAEAAWIENRLDGLAVAAAN